MTNKEAATIVKRIRYYMEGSECWTDAEFIAMDMAVKALEQPEIVRCKDCKYYIPYEWMFDGLSRSSNRNDYAPDEIGCAANDHNYPPEGFCSYAERRTNECTD